MATQDMDCRENVTAMSRSLERVVRLLGGEVECEMLKLGIATVGLE